MLQIVPVEVLEETQLDVQNEITPADATMLKQKTIQKRVDKEKKIDERERKRKEREALKKEREKRRQLRLKLKTEKMIQVSQ